MSEEELYSIEEDLEETMKINKRLQQENQQLKEKLEMQKDSNKLLCKAITCDDCDCNVCDAHKQNIRLEEQLKQRGEVIDEAIKYLSKILDRKAFLYSDLRKIVERLQKYKGDNNENTRGE